VHLRHPIAFDAVDERPVSQLLVLLVPEAGARDDHLQLLALAARLFSDRRFRAQLDRVPDAIAAGDAFRNGIARLMLVSQ
jgi:PTS system nitrogen regulatory IIA component